MNARRFIAAACAVIVASFLVGKFVLLLEPAVARENVAACTGLKPKAVPEALVSEAYRSLPMPVPDFEVQDWNGKMRRLSEFRGQVVFLNFWATWCPPCKEEVPSIEELQRLLGDDGFTVVALASAPDWNDILQEFPDGTDMTILLDPPSSEDEQIGAIARAFGVPALPETFVIDRHGFIRYYFVNKRDWKSDVAVTCMRSLLQEEDSLPWLKSWLWTMSQTSFGS